MNDIRWGGEKCDLFVPGYSQREKETKANSKNTSLRIKVSYCRYLPTIAERRNDTSENIFKRGKYLVF